MILRRIGVARLKMGQLEPCVERVLRGVRPLIGADAQNKVMQTSKPVSRAPELDRLDWPGQQAELGAELSGRRDVHASTSAGRKRPSCGSMLCTVQVPLRYSRTPNQTLEPKCHTLRSWLLGALVVRACSVTVNSWEPWCSERVTSQLALGSFGGKELVTSL